ncbi:MAG: phosphotransferase [Deltaproteobacteria bacterium]|nr:phosphotransferase [Deltaproteobacteria bacterium]
MIHLSRRSLKTYLRRRFGADIELLSFGRIGEAAAEDDSPKKYGYGAPILIQFRAGGELVRVVLETMSPGPFGHEHRADRAQAMIWDYDTYAKLPRHVRAVDVGAVTNKDELVSLADADEMFVLNEYAEGTGYAADLERLLVTDRLEDLDRDRMVALIRYLAQIHQLRREDSDLYRRRLRELIGHGECIMGLTDSYPVPYEFVTARTLRLIEEGANRWRWKLHDRAERLSQVHGDFHPWNILFREGTDFSVLDRSRGEWGEPADDVTALTINYLFFSLRRHGRLAGPFEVLFRETWDRYREITGDWDVVRAAPPFFAFRGLVIASPRWYPDLSVAVRRSLFCFIENVLADDRFDPADANRYCEV